MDSNRFILVSVFVSKRFGSTIANILYSLRCVWNISHWHIFPVSGGVRIGLGQGACNRRVNYGNLATIHQKYL